MLNNKSEITVIIRPIIFISVVIIIVAAIGYFTLGKRSETIQGEIEVTEYRVSSKVPGRIISFSVDEGDHVEAGDTLARLEAPEVQAKMEQAQAAESAAQALNEKAERGTRQEQIQGAYELWKKSEAGVEVANKTFNRFNVLFKEGVIPAQKMDEIKAQRDAAIATEKAAKSQYDMAVNGAQREDKMAAAAMVNRARGAVNEVKSYIKETYLIASAPGEVTDVFPKVGELVGTGAPIMNVSELYDMWVTFNVREDLLKNLKMGATVTGIIPALENRKVQLKVYYIKDEGTYATWKATKSTGQFDMKTFEVKARPTSPIKDIRPGMSVVLDR